MSRSRAFFPMLVVSLFCSSGSSVQAVAYDFVLIVEAKGTTGSPITEFRGNPSINNIGEVAFVSPQGIFFGSGGDLTTITTLVSSVSGNASINSAGEVAFLNQTTGVFKGSGGAITTIADTVGVFSSFGGGPSINDDGLVAFGAGLDSGEAGIFVGNGGAVVTIADSSGSFSGLAGNPSINSDGYVSFKAFQDSGGEGIYFGNGGSLVTIADTNGSAVVMVGGAPDINDPGIVAFDGTLQDPPFYTAAILIGDGSSLTTFVDANGPFFAFDSPPDINNIGTIAFRARLDTDVAGGGIFVGPDPLLDLLIQKGDGLDGAFVNTFISNIGLNDLGQVAFTVTLSDGRDAIFRADPITVVPQPIPVIPNWGPILFGLLVLGASLLMVRRRLRLRA